MSRNKKRRTKRTPRKETRAKEERKLGASLSAIPSSSGFGGVAFKRKGWHFDPNKPPSGGCVYIERTRKEDLPD